MINKTTTAGRNVVDLARFRAQRLAPAALSVCRYCGADLADDEKEEDCSGAWVRPAVPQPVPRRFHAE